MKIRETQILCKLIWGGMRVSGYFVDGGRGKSDPWGIEDGCRLGLWARRLVEPLRLIKLAFWVYWRCLALGEAPGGNVDGGTMTSGDVPTPCWWPEPAQRRKARQVTTAERSQVERTDEKQAVWPKFQPGPISRLPTRQAGQHLNALSVCFWFLEGFNHGPKGEEKRCQVICFPT